MSLNSDISLSTILQLVGMVVAGAVIFGASMQKDEAQDQTITSLERQISSLERQLERERDERLAYQRNSENNSYPRDVVDRTMRIIEWRNRMLREERQGIQPAIKETRQ